MGSDEIKLNQKLDGGQHVFKPLLLFDYIRCGDRNTLGTRFPIAHRIS